MHEIDGSRGVDIPRKAVFKGFLHLSIYLSELHGPVGTDRCLDEVIEAAQIGWGESEVAPIVPRAMLGLFHPRR
jgi:hypothetical protein